MQLVVCGLYASDYIMIKVNDLGKGKYTQVDVHNVHICTSTCVY